MNVFVVLYEKSFKKLIPSETTVLYCPSTSWLAELKHVNLFGDPVSTDKTHENKSFDSTSLLRGQKVAIYFEHFP